MGKYLFVIIFWVFYIKISFHRFFITFINKERKQKNTILFLENFPIENSGYQYRAKKWADIFVENGYTCDVKTLVDNKQAFDRLLREKDLSLFFIKSLWRRFFQLLTVYRYKTVIVRRELLLFNDYGNLFLEKFLLKIHPNVILDFDDDIAASKNQPREITNWYGRLMMEDGNKFNNSLRLYKRFIVASAYLKNRVMSENAKVAYDDILVIPTCVDYNLYPAKIYPETIQKITFGWIGGDYNYNLLDLLLPVLEELSDQYNFKLLVIGGEKYARNVKFELEFVPWSLDTEIKNLYRIDVGLMPLVDDAENRGKGGFKLIQYMGLGIVSIASALTINKEIVDHGENSFLAESLSDWRDVFVYILEGNVNFKEMGHKAKERIHSCYTFDANKEKYVNFVSLCVE